MSMTGTWQARGIGGALAVAGVLAGCTLATTVANAAPAPGISLPAGFSATVFAAGGNLTQPDDITRLGDSIFVSYQNGVGSKGEVSKTGQTASTVVEYDTHGTQVAHWNLAGKVDGLNADIAGHRIVATVNEDGNSSLYTITPSAVGGALGSLLDAAGSSGGSSGGEAHHYRFSPDPLPHGGGTDSIAFVGNSMYVTASAPAADKDGTTYSKPALYKVTLAGDAATATPVLEDNSAATDAVGGKRVKLNLSDPDSSMLMPAGSPRFAGQLMLDSQGDGEQIFLADPGAADPKATVLKLSTQVDDTVVATAAKGTLLVTDNATDQVLAITGPFTRGQVFTAVPSDSTVLPGTLGQLDLNTGAITAFGAHLKNPHGLLFVPAGR